MERRREAPNSKEVIEGGKSGRTQDRKKNGMSVLDGPRSGGGGNKKEGSWHGKDGIKGGSRSLLPFFTTPSTSLPSSSPFYEPPPSFIFTRCIPSARPSPPHLVSPPFSQRTTTTFLEKLRLLSESKLQKRASKKYKGRVSKRNIDGDGAGGSRGRNPQELELSSQDLTFPSPPQDQNHPSSDLPFQYAGLTPSSTSPGPFQGVLSILHNLGLPDGGLCVV
ncbi:hypothetical protein Pcinc_033641 [Petrolisthes cinctipes]|uniref:Uncharacterized protein n=1 Tax=Petrolisthes cinctipes TaxID=88211 RepID=A0AAE1ERR6_PETCI|nr:hypothetical protein Pcinc_033641 [Petrolisthes cinctipes]